MFSIFLFAGRSVFGCVLVNDELIRFGFKERSENWLCFLCERLEVVVLWTFGDWLLDRRKALFSIFLLSGRLCSVS